MTHPLSVPNMVEHALMYARRGWLVFPLHSARPRGCSCEQPDCSSVGKHPRTKHGVKDATTSEQVIRAWWRQWPDANIGIATGPASGLYVIDVDCEKGGELASLEPYDLAELLCTAIVRTGSGGYHLYLKCSEPLPNTANKLGPFIDTRGLGGYVVAPPSRNANGEYAWEMRDEETLEPIPLVPLPPALLSALGKAGRAASATTNGLMSEKTQKQEKIHGLSTSGTQNDLQTPAPGGTLPVSPAAAREDAAGTARSVTREQTSLIAQEARNVFLTSTAGKLCRTLDLDQETVEAVLRTINERRYGQGKHPQGALPEREVEGICKSIPLWLPSTSGRGLGGPLIESMAQVMATPPPATRWIIPGLLPEGLCLFSGKPKGGKSWLIFDVQIGCALGSRVGGLVLGRYQVEPMGAFYLSLEDTPARFYERGQKLLGGRPVPQNFARALDWKPLLAGGLHDLETWLVVHPETRLVVIDTLARVRTASSGSSSMYQEDSDLMAQLQQLAKEHHIALVLVHHLRKMGSSDIFDEVSGSTGLTGVADTTFVLKRERNQNEGVLHVTGRQIEEQELSMTFQPASGHWLCNGKAAEREVSQGKQEILTLLREHGTMTPSEIAQALEKPRAALATFLFRMVQEGLIVKNGRGLYTLKQAGENQLWDTEEAEWESLSSDD